MMVYIKPQKFRCKKEPFRHFRGYAFVLGVATEVRDTATINELLKHPDFERIDDEEIKRQAPSKEVLTRLPPVRPVLSLRRGK